MPIEIYGFIAFFIAIAVGYAYARWQAHKIARLEQEKTALNQQNQVLTVRVENQQKRRQHEEANATSERDVLIERLHEQHDLRD